MSIECIACGTRSNTVAYRRPPIQRRYIVGLDVLIGIGAVGAILTAIRVTIDATQIADVASHVEAQLTGDTPFPDAQVRDGARVFYSASLLLFGALLAALIALPVRYISILVNSRRGHPKTLRRVRRAAAMQFGLGVFSLFLVLYLFGNTETLEPEPVVGLHALIAPVILWYTTIPQVRDHFSAFSIKRLADAPVTPVSRHPPPPE